MKILLADDHTLIRENLTEFLERSTEKFEVVGVSTFDEAYRQVHSGKTFDLIVLDWVMPGMNGVLGIQKMMKKAPSTPTVILFGMPDSSVARKAIEAGAKGFIPKTISGPALINVLNLVLSGETYIPEIVMHDDAQSDPTVSRRSSHRLLEGSPFEKLTPRESEVLGLLVKGLTNKGIAKSLSIEEVTVKTHLQHVFEKIGAANRAQAVSMALSSGWSNEDQ